jgi:hypothetical protein
MKHSSFDWEMLQHSSGNLNQLSFDLIIKAGYLCSHTIKKQD